MGHVGNRAWRICAFALLVLSAVATVRTGSAQSIVLDLTRQPLVDGLAQIASQTGTDIVYAERLVHGVLVSCRYRGTRIQDALDCLLEETRLVARWTGGTQFVLVESAALRSRFPVAGFVRDAASRAPLAGAHIYLPELERGAIANRTGYFSFPSLPAGPHRLRISYIGYRTLDTLVVATAQPMRFSMTSAALESGMVVVEAIEPRPGDRTPLPGMEAPPMNRLERLPASLGGKDLLEALSWLPGVRRSGEVTGGLLIRGAGPDQNLYLLDGAPVYHPWHAFSLISTFQTETFRSVRLYRGAFPAEFGGRLSAVLDAELSDGKGTEPQARAAVNTHSGRFLIETPITSRSSFMLGGRRSYIDRLIGRSHPVVDEAGRRDTLRTGYYFYDWTAKIVFRPDRQSRLSITSYTGKDDLDLRLPFDLSLDLSSWLRPADLFFEIGEFWRNRTLSARYERLLSTRWYLTVTGYDSRYRAREAAFLRPTLAASVQSDYGVDLRDLGLRADLDYYRYVNTDIRMGIQVVDRTFDSDVDAIIQYNPGLTEVLRQESSADATEVAAWIQSTWRARPYLEISSGLRAAAFGSDRLARLEPRLSFQWTIHPHRLLIKGSVSRTYQYLHRVRDRHSYLYDIVSTRWIPSAAETPPAKGTEYAVGLESTLRWVHLRTGAYVRFQENVLLPRDAFQSKEDLSGPGIEIGTLLGQYVQGQARASGLETSVTVERTRLLASLSLSAERSVTRSPEQESFRPARFDVPRSLRGFAEYRSGSWAWSLGLTLRSGYPITVPRARYSLSGPLEDTEIAYLYRPDFHNGRLPVYHRLDASVARRATWLGTSLRFQLQVYNVLNQRNVIDRLFEPTETGYEVRNRRGLPLIPLFEIEMIL